MPPGVGAVGAEGGGAPGRSGAAAGRAGLRRVLVTLCATEITSWGVLYYAFPVLAGRITATTGWSAATITAAFSAAQLVAAGVGIPVGRVLDRRGPRVPMAVGSLVGVLAIVVVATAADLAWFVAGWLAAGAAMGATLYPPAFAALTRWHGPDRVRALTVLTLAAGLASTVFAPLTAGLVGWLDWRGAYLVLAAVLAAVAVPGHWFGLRLPWPERPERRTRAAPPRSGAPFVVLVVAVCLAGFTASAVVVTLIPLLTERGMDTATAAVALGLGGVGQVAGRLGYPALARRTSVRTRTAVVLLAMAATTAALGVCTGLAGLVAAAVAAGLARGVFTLLHATAVTDRWGTAHYGRLTGLLSAPATAARALAPFAGTAMAVALGGYPAAFLVLAGIAVLAATLSLVTYPEELP